jgi:hypothetical protein
VARYLESATDQVNNAGNKIHMAFLGEPAVMSRPSFLYSLMSIQSTSFCLNRRKVIPGMLCLLVGVVSLVLPWLLRIDELVCPIAQHPAGDKWSLPRRGQLVHAFSVLDQLEHEVSFAEFERMNLLAVITPQLLLVERYSGQGQFLCLLEEVDAIFVGFFGLPFNVLTHSWRVEFDVSGQHSFCSVVQKEGCEADRAIWSAAQAPEY